MVGRHWAQALVPTEPWGLTLEAEEALSGPWGRVIGGLDASPAAAGACLYPAHPEAAAPQVLAGTHLDVLLQGQGAFLPVSPWSFPTCYFQPFAVVNNPAPSVCTSHRLPFGLFP